MIVVLPTHKNHGWRSFSSSLQNPKGEHLFLTVKTVHKKFLNNSATSLWKFRKSFFTAKIDKIGSFQCQKWVKCRFCLNTNINFFKRSSIFWFTFDLRALIWPSRHSTKRSVLLYRLIKKKKTPNEKIERWKNTSRLPQPLAHYLHSPPFTT